MKKVTIRDVARTAGVSVATVSRTINGKGLVAPDTVWQIQEAIRSTGYVLPENAVLQPCTPEQEETEGADDAGLVYLVIKRLSHNTYASLLMKSMIRIAADHGVEIVPVNIECDLSERSKDPVILSVVGKAKKTRARGVIISGFNDGSMENETRQILKNAGVPVVFINRKLSSFMFNRVLTGGDRGAYLATQHMIENGKRRLFMIQLAGHKGKTEGFYQAVRECGMDAVTGIVVEAADETPECSYEAARRIFLEHPDIDGILCSEDELAAGVLRYLSESGKRIPEDVELIGYNDNLASYLMPPISSVRVPFDEISKNALQMLLNENQSTPGVPAKTVLLDPQLVLR